jgi:hypothetical protein
MIVALAKSSATRTNLMRFFYCQRRFTGVNCMCRKKVTSRESERKSESLNNLSGLKEKSRVMRPSF